MFGKGREREKLVGMMGIIVTENPGVGEGFDGHVESSAVMEAREEFGIDQL